MSYLRYANLITRQDVVQFFYPPSVAKDDTNIGPGSNAWKKYVFSLSCYYFLVIFLIQYDNITISTIA